MNKKCRIERPIVLIDSSCLVYTDTIMDTDSRSDTITSGSNGITAAITETVETLDSNTDQETDSEKAESMSFVETDISTSMATTSGNLVTGLITTMTSLLVRISGQVTVDAISAIFSS
jgi:hypothetical protein